jgi:hypothetical protein
MLRVKELLLPPILLLFLLLLCLLCFVPDPLSSVGMGRNAFLGSSFAMVSVTVRTAQMKLTAPRSATDQVCHPLLSSVFCARTVTPLWVDDVNCQGVYLIM